ncbi:MAG TPA: phosphonatase-like hydrolase [Cytophagales bacterium]|jgi:phosphonatase-like hydrolase|nr:phosphonatase-like hydrolase [Cytophagales bacterium]
MTNIQLAVFDIAGTTINEGNVVYKTLQKAIKQRGFEAPLDYVLEQGAGKEKYQAIKDILQNQVKGRGEEKEMIAGKIFKEFRQMLEEAYQKLNIKPFDGVHELIKHLRKAGVKIALNTGYDKQTANLLLNKMKWRQGKEYDVLITADDVSSGRPGPDMILEAMKATHVDNPEFVLKAGDSIIDIQEGKNAKCGITVGVTTGAHTYSQLESAQPTYIVNTLKDLIQILEV